MWPDPHRKNDLGTARDEKKLSEFTTRKPEVYEAASLFRFGNGATETSRTAARIPVFIAGKAGLIDAAIIEGQILKSPLKMSTNSAGQVFDQPARVCEAEQAGL